MKFTFLDSFWKPSFYQNENNVLSFWKGLGRLVLVNLCIGIVTAVVLHASFGKNIPSYIESVSSKVIDGYPSSLVLTLNNGILSKNIPGTLNLYPVASFFNSENDVTYKDGSTPTYFLVIDETKEASLSVFAASQAVIFLGKDGMVAKSDNETKIQAYKDLGGSEKEMSFSKDMLVKLVNVVKEYTRNAPAILFAVVVIGYVLVAPLVGVIASLFYGLVIMLLSVRLLGRKYTYGESYVLSMYALASVILVESLISYIPNASLVVSMIPFFTTILIVVFLWRMLKRRHATHVPTDASTSVVH